MATVVCCYRSLSGPPLHRRRVVLPPPPPAQLRTAAGGGQQQRRRRPSLQLQVAATAAGGGRAESVKEATDAEFFRPADTRPIMLFDGVCNLCNGGVRFVREHDPNRYIPLQSESGRKLLQRSGRAPDDISSVVLVEKDRSYIKSEAVLRIMEYLNLPFPQLATFLKVVPLFLRDFAYDNVADNRYTVFGRSESESCEIL
ncbi:DCC family protein At1g52590, chloroplastic isoform X2 [Oryza brachyantha]|uniref:DCC family protein At1g52590, chloroplastic isoform X2 n=1 Tax=Oryza brachyantha TaxID=4533 RepID=UPI001ADC48B0|nr:DCC family protein At1g52590, chloroplastic isoform X2 [Oryza brachyantha]